jgi:hypothetical protein
MALGEEILLYRAEDAENLVRFARKHNCSASKKVLTTIHTEMNLKGKIGTFLAFVQGMLDKEDTLSSEARNLFREAADELHHRKEILGEFFTSHKEGDRIDQGPLWERLQKLTETDNQQSSLSAEDKEFLRDQYLVLVLLQENELVETKEGGMYLRGAVYPDGAITQYPADLLLEPESEELAAHDLTRLITTYSDTSYPVALGPESVLMIELDKLEEFCSNCEVDEDSFARAMMNLALKKMIVDKIILFLRDRKRTTREEIQDLMRDFDLAIPDTVDQFSFHLHTSFIDEILDDLHRMKTIQGKDNKIRYAGK